MSKFSLPLSPKEDQYYYINALNSTVSAVSFSDSSLENEEDLGSYECPIAADYIPERYSNGILDTSKNKKLEKKFHLINKPDIVGFLNQNNNIYKALNILYKEIQNSFDIKREKPSIEYFRFKPNHFESLNVNIRVKKLEDKEFENLWKTRREFLKKVDRESRLLINISICEK